MDFRSLASPLDTIPVLLAPDREATDDPKKINIFGMTRRVLDSNLLNRELKLEKSTVANANDKAQVVLMIQCYIMICI